MLAAVHVPELPLLYSPISCTSGGYHDQGKEPCSFHTLHDCVDVTSINMKRQGSRISICICSVVYQSSALTAGNSPKGVLQETFIWPFPLHRPVEVCGDALVCI